MMKNNIYCGPITDAISKWFKSFSNMLKTTLNELASLGIKFRRLESDNLPHAMEQYDKDNASDDAEDNVRFIEAYIPSIDIRLFIRIEQLGENLFNIAFSDSNGRFRAYKKITNDQFKKKYLAIIDEWYGMSAEDMQAE